MKLSGLNGVAYEEFIEPETIDQTGNIGTWFFKTEHPVLPWNLINVVHLREIEGGRPVLKQFPEATHELITASLDPERTKHPATTSRDFGILLPINIVVQFTVPDDEAAKEILKKAVQACVDGRLWPDPEGIIGMRTMWKNFIKQEELQWRE
jgi:hypothetical protein